MELCRFACRRVLAASLTSRAQRYWRAASETKTAASAIAAPERKTRSFRGNFIHDSSSERGDKGPGIATGGIHHYNEWIPWTRDDAPGLPATVLSVPNFRWGTGGSDVNSLLTENTVKKNEGII